MKPIQILTKPAAALLKLLCGGAEPTEEQVQAFNTIHRTMPNAVLSPRTIHEGTKAESLIVDPFVNAVWALVFSMAERGTKGDEPWWGQDYLKVKQMLEGMGLNCDPEKAFDGEKRRTRAAKRR